MRKKKNKDSSLRCFQFKKKTWTLFLFYSNLLPLGIYNIPSIFFKKNIRSIFDIQYIGLEN